MLHVYHTCMKGFIWIQNEVLNKNSEIISLTYMYKYMWNLIVWNLFYFYLISKGNDASPSSVAPGELLLVSVNPALDPQKEEEIDEEALLNTEGQSDNVVLGVSAGKSEATLEENSDLPHHQSGKDTNTVSVETKSQTSTHVESNGSTNKDLPRACDTEAK